MSEKTVDEDQVRGEHLAQVRQPMRWSLLGAVIGGGTVLMLVLIAILGAGSGS